MTGLARRGWRIGVARTCIEIAVLLAGIALGGTAGVGTVLFAFTIGPLVHWWLPRFALAVLVAFLTRRGPVRERGFVEAAGGEAD